jgi:membrane fusion protein (multidrug efflux system)
VVALTACERVKTAEKKGAPSPPAVVVAEVLQRTVPIYSEYVGRTEVLQTVELRARAGELRAKQDVDRFRPLAEQQAIPQQDLDNALTRQLEAQAQVRAAEYTLQDAKLNQKTTIELAEAAIEQAQAALTQADLNLGYTTIKAPVDGIIGVLQVDKGNLVGRGGATLLATMSTVDPFKVAFNVSELDFLTFIEKHRQVREGDPAADRTGPTFELILADGRIYPYPGRPRTLDRALDPRTGTILVEGIFPNPDNYLRAGQFGRVRVAAEERPNAILVPQRAGGCVPRCSIRGRRSPPSRAGSGGPGGPSRGTSPGSTSTARSRGFTPTWAICCSRGRPSSSWPRRGFSCSWRWSSTSRYRRTAPSLGGGCCSR